MMSARLVTINFTCWVVEEFFCKFKCIFYNSFWLAIVYSEFVNVH